MIGAGDHVVPEEAIGTPDAVGDALDRGRSVNAQVWLGADALVEARHQEAEIIGDVVGVQVGEKQVVYRSAGDAEAVHFKGRCGAAVDHQPLVADFEDETGAPAVASGGGRTGTDNV